MTNGYRKWILLLTAGAMALLCPLHADPAEDTPKYDNLALGVPGKADTIVDRPGYALGYIEYHEQPAWVIYKLTREEATTKAANLAATKIDLGAGDDKMTMDVDSILNTAIDMGAGDDIFEITGITSLETNIAGSKVISGEIQNCEKFKVDGVDVVLGKATQIAGAGTTETTDDDVWVQLYNQNGQAKINWAKSESGLDVAGNALMQLTENNPQIGDCAASTSTNPTSFEKKNNGTLA